MREISGASTDRRDGKLSESERLRLIQRADWGNAMYVRVIVVVKFCHDGRGWFVNGLALALYRVMLAHYYHLRKSTSRSH